MTDHVARDIRIVKACMGQDVEQIGIFGSAVDGLNASNDVDVVLKVQPGDEDIVAASLRHMRLSLPVLAVDMNGYRVRGHQCSPQGYHFLVLGLEEAKGQFDARNRATVCYM